MDEPAARVTRTTRGPMIQIGRVRQFEWTRAELEIPGLPPTLAGLRIIQLADIHLRPAWMAAYDRLFEKLAADPPDLILLTGDLVEDKFDPTPALPNARRFMAGLTAKLGIFSILGNHDAEFMGPHIAAMNGRLINGERIELPGPGATTIELLGVPGPWRRSFTDDYIATVPPRPPNALRIAMTHYPDATPRIAEHLQPDLVFAGHTHGGQICLPGGVPILKHTTLPRRYVSGIHRLSGTWMVVSRGMGFATVRVRAFCPAEVVDVVLL